MSTTNKILTWQVLLQTVSLRDCQLMEIGTLLQHSTIAFPTYKTIECRLLPPSLTSYRIISTQYALTRSSSLPPPTPRGHTQTLMTRPRCRNSNSRNHRAPLSHLTATSFDGLWILSRPHMWMSPRRSRAATSGCLAARRSPPPPTAPAPAGTTRAMTTGSCEAAVVRAFSRSRPPAVEGCHRQSRRMAGIGGSNAAMRAVAA